MKYPKLHNGRRAKVDDDFSKLTDAERAEFIELLRDSFDPGLYDEDDLPMLRANKKKFEEEQQREEGSQRWSPPAKSGSRTAGRPTIHTRNEHVRSTQG